MTPRHWPWATLPGSALRYVIPSSCALCGATCPEALCSPCRSQFFQQRPSRCQRCALPTTSSPICGDCLGHPPAFDATIVATDYLPPIDQLVLALKFGGSLALAPLFGTLLHETLVSGGTPASGWPTVLAPVPLGRQRLGERGFNQALEIARPLARSLTLRLEPRLLARVRETPAQAGLAARQRQKNLHGAFIVPYRSARLVAGQHIGIVDDVMTTGETLHEVAATLKRFGASRVTNLVFARTLPR